MHRKGVTRAFGPGRSEVPTTYRNVGQPVLIGGTMETGSRMMVGTEFAMNETFGSAVHGAGRAMSRSQAKREARGESIKRRMKEKGILLDAPSPAEIAEEARDAYKDVDEVVDATHNIGIAKKVFRTKPIIVLKG